VKLLQLDWRTRLVLGLTTLLGLVAFAWPLFIPASSGIEAHPHDAPLVVLLLLPLLMLIAVSEVTSGRIESKHVALLGILAAVAAALRPLGAGAIGIEPMWFIIIVGGYVFGSGFGFLLGSVSLFASALITGGVGPWLPFQMLAASWIGLGAGLLPHRGRRTELLLIAAYGIGAAFAFGLLMDLQFWPWALGTTTELSYQPGGAVAENLNRFLTFHFVTALSWDLPRAITNALLILFAGPALLGTLRRAARRAVLMPID
jgi:energy-coupling factor transport system substrate-specific component